MADKALSALTTAVLALDDSVPFTDTSDANATKKAVGVPVLTAAQIAASATGTTGLTAAGVMSNLAGATVLTATTTLLTAPGSVSLGAGNATLLAGTANILEQSNGTTAQTLRLFNTKTDASNGEWGAMRWNSNVLEIGAYANGTGTVRNVTMIGAGIGINMAPATYSGGVFGLSIKGGGTYSALMLDCDQPLIKWKGSYNAGNGAELYQNGSGKFILNVNGSISGFAITDTGSVGFGDVTSPTAKLHLPAGTAVANTAPLKLNSGTNLTTPENGAFEYNGTNLFFTRTGAVREGVITQSAVTTEAVASDTTVTVNIGGTTYKLLARA